MPSKPQAFANFKDCISFETSQGRNLRGVPSSTAARGAGTDSQVKVTITSDGQSVLLSNPIWGPKPDFCYCQTFAVLSVTRGWVCHLSWPYSAVHDIYIYKFTCQHST
jgi:hypothetical protein